MKKFIFGLIAIITFGQNSFSQDFDAYGIEHNRMLKIVISKYDKNINNKNVFDITKSIGNSTFPQYDSNAMFNFKNYSHHYQC